MVMLHVHAHLVSSCDVHNFEILKGMPISVRLSVVMLTNMVLTYG